MIVADLIKELSLTVVAAAKGIDSPVTGGYSSDLLSNVMGYAIPGSIWITMQGHQNIIAVASLAGLAAVVVAGGVEPEKASIEKANTKGIVLLTSPLPVFEVVGQLYQLGIRG